MQMSVRRCSTLWLVLAVALCSVSGCSQVYFKTMEQFGVHKRDILVDRVEEARDAQQEAKEQFQTALEKFTELTGFSGGTLETKYNKLSAEYERSSAGADEVRNRIAAVEDVAEALFKEWESELGQYSSASLRRSSQQQLDQTRRRYSQLIGAMHRAEKKIAPVLSVFHDQVLFLKHNLNAQAIASLRSELTTMETDIASLIREMEASIDEADAFISAMAKDQ